MSQLIFGRNPVIEALKAELSVEKIFLLHGVHGRSIQTIRSLARNQKIPLEEVDRQRWGQLGGTEKAQGIIALLSEIPAFELGDILQRAKERGEAPLIALVDGIEDPRNLGAIIRSAEGAGFHGLIMPKRRAVGLTETVVRTSAGALAHLPVAKVTNLVPVIEQLKNSGLWI
ncbi:MAG: RNA methyltransferase, partial [candidate division KSB1 bacterium]|nr:RNA methyltransferase [candidate division KSB1 bacterium]